MPELIAIDFGTTKTAVAVRARQNGSGPSIMDFGGTEKNQIETVLRFNPDGSEIEQWGAEAWDNYMQYPDRTFFEFKPEIGGTKEFDVAGNKKNASFLTTEFLRKLREILGKSYNGTPITTPQFTTWIGYPAEWNVAQRTQLKICAQEAGWPQVDLCDEATATAFYFANNGDLPADKACTFMVFDFGGGTLDICIMKMDEKRMVEILAVGGNSRIGGRRFDQCLVDHFRNEIMAEAKVATLQSRDDAEIRNVCRKLKERLSTQIKLYDKDQASITIPHLFALNEESYELTLSRTLFEALTESLRQECADVIEDVIKKAGINKNHIDKVLTAGGSSDFYFVRKLIKSALPSMKDSDIVRAAQPGEVVAKGLGLYPVPEGKWNPVRTPPPTPTLCKTCHGEGSITCPRCKGLGTLKKWWLWRRKKPCQKCDNKSGVILCPDCMGRRV